MNVIFNIFVYIVWFIATFYSVYFISSLLIYKNQLFIGKKNILNKNPKITMLIPAYNEEKSIAYTIKSLKELTYNNLEFFIMSDGSKDKTIEVAKTEAGNDSRFVLIDNKINKGKAATLNQGIKLATGEFVVCMDADSVAEKGIIEKVIPYFNDEKVGAVTVSIEVKNPKTILEKLIALEFALGLSLFLKLFSFFDSIFVTPGPFSMYRKSTLEHIGGYDTKNITEDLEIAYRLHKYGYRIENCIEAKAYTILPDTFKGIYIQRRRWYSGALQTISKHKDMILNKKYNFFGYYLPFHYGLIFLGLFTFTYSTYLVISKFIKNISYFQYTNFNFLEHLFYNFDILNFNKVNLLSIIMFITTVLIAVLGIKSIGKKIRDNKVGFLSYPLLFFLYQIFWTGAIIAVLKGKKIKWR